MSAALEPTCRANWIWGWPNICGCFRQINLRMVSANICELSIPPGGFLLTRAVDDREILFELLCHLSVKWSHWKRISSAVWNQLKFPEGPFLVQSGDLIFRGSVCQHETSASSKNFQMKITCEYFLHKP